MNGREKIHAEHRDRRAFVYARQSTQAQVLQHRSSTQRQVELVDVAAELGWAPSQIELIDDDLGRSGKSTEQRDGFQRLAAEMSLGRVGAVLSLDASRLARSSADWHRLLEIAVLTRTLLVDEQTVYDPRDPNDRLLLGMKGTMADFELVWLRQRMEGGKWHLARRGQYRVRPPVGYVYEDVDSTQLMFDPDEEIRRAVELVFERYRTAGTSRDVVEHFARHDLRFPSRFGKRVEWRRLTLCRVHTVLSNPLYTGAYVYGRHRGEMVLAAGERRRRVRRIPMSDWPVNIRDAHPSYLSWEDFLANQRRMSQNAPSRGDGTGAVREGRALLQGILLCGRCGNRMTVRYKGQNGRYASYSCARLQMDVLSEHRCLDVYARNLDEPVVDLVLGALTQDSLIDASRVIDLVDEQNSTLERQWKLRIERIRYEVKRAERQYDACEPENRVVARTLEKRWNEKLVELETLEREFEQVQQRQRLELSEIERRRILQLAGDLPRLWRAKDTTDRDRKLLLRLLLKDVAVRAVDVPRTCLRVKALWHTGAVTELEVDRPGRGAARRPIVSRVVSTYAADAEAALHPPKQAP